MGRMKELMMMSEFDRDHLMMCETRDLVDYITYLQNEGPNTLTLDDLNAQVARLRRENEELTEKIEKICEFQERLLNDRDTEVEKEVGRVKRQNAVYKEFLLYSGKI